MASRGITLRRFVVTAALFVCACAPLSAQQSSHPPFPIRIFAGAGLALPTGAVTVFADSGYRSLTPGAGFFGGAGILLGPFKMRSRIEWAFQADISFGTSGTSEYRLGKEAFRLAHRYAPVMFWYRLNNIEDLHFFIGVGAGAAWHELTIDHAASPDERASAWCFAWGACGGAGWRLGARLDAEVYIQLISLEGVKNLERSRGYGVDVNGRYMVAPAVVRISWAL